MDISKSRKGMRIDTDSPSIVTADDSLKILEKYYEYKEHCDLGSLAVLSLYLTDTGICVALKLRKYLKRLVVDLFKTKFCWKSALSSSIIVEQVFSSLGLLGILLGPFLQAVWNFLSTLEASIYPAFQTSSMACTIRYTFTYDIVEPLIPLFHKDIYVIPANTWEQKFHNLSSHKIEVCIAIAQHSTGLSCSS